MGARLNPRSTKYLKLMRTNLEQLEVKSRWMFFHKHRGAIAALIIHLLLRVLMQYRNIFIEPNQR